MLSDGEIAVAIEAGHLVIYPTPEAMALQPASIDLRLGAVDDRYLCCDPSSEEGVHWLLEPGDFALATTLETVEIPADLAARVEGKSSWGRKGLAVHITAGFIDPGFKGQITLELKNMGNDPVVLDEDDYICQLSFFQLTSPALRPYGSAGLGSHYQNQSGITQSRMEK